MRSLGVVLYQPLIGDIADFGKGVGIAGDAYDVYIVGKDCGIEAAIKAEGAFLVESALLFCWVLVFFALIVSLVIVAVLGRGWLNVLRENSGCK